MTWANYIATGVGGDGIEFRLVIEGAAFEFCSTEEMAIACTETGQTGKTRVHGLLREGLGFSESAYLAGAEMSVSINAVRIIETPYPYLNSACSIFAALPQTQCYLAATLETADATVTVDDDTDLTVGDFVHSATETLKIASKLGAGVCGVSRGQWRTTAQRHTVATAGGAPAVRPLRDGVRIWAGRRCWLYAHGPSEFGASDTGAIIWRGKLAGEPQLDADAITWSLPIDSRWGLLDQEIGAGLDKPRALRGAYYPGSYGFTCYVIRSDGATRGGPYTTSGTTPIVIQLFGHYESNEDYAQALVDALNATGLGSIYSFAYRIVNGQWEILVTMPASTPRYLEFFGGSHVDGWFTGTLVADTDVTPGTGLGPGVGTVVVDETYIIGWGDGAARGGFSGGGDFAVPLADMRRIPRSINGASDGWAYGTESDIATYPSALCYLDDAVGIAAGDTLLITQGEAPTVSREVVTVNSSAGSVLADASLNTVASGATTAEIKVSKTFGATAGTTLDGFRDALIADAPEYANEGSTPWVLDDDIASWTLIVAVAAAGHDYLLRRIYQFYQGVRASDVIKHELRAHGLHPYLDADGKVAVRPITTDTAAVAADRHLRDDNGTLLTDDSFGEMRSGEDGNVNAVEIFRGYDPVDDKHKAGSITAVTVEGVSEAKKRRILEIKPKVRPAGSEPTYDDAMRLSDPIRSMFGGQILVYVFGVPITLWSVLVGDQVLVTSPQLPFAGMRGVHDPGDGLVSRTATVIGREWDVENGTGKFSLLVTGLNIAGYAPSARVVGQTGATSSWDVEVESNRYAPSGAQDAAYFDVGFRVRVVEWDADLPTVVLGEVTAVDLGTNTISIDFDAAWTPGVKTWNLSFAPSDDAYLAAAQLEYCYVASATRRIDDGATGTTARVFAP